MAKPLLVTSVLSAFLSAQAFGYEVTDQFSIGGVFAGAGQCQVLNGTFPTLASETTDPTSDEFRKATDQCRGALPIQPELSFRPNDRNEVFFKLGFAAGNGLNSEAVTPFNIAPWAADLEDDVRNINGRNRDYLLTAWYKYVARLQGGSGVGVAFGIIDATDYLDENKYSNDEYTQFMNSALVNGPNVFLPSYDLGTAVGWENERWSVRGVYMNVGENDDGNNFNFFGAQLGFHPATGLGEGNYRIIVDGASEAFLDPMGTSEEPRSSVLVSIDQELGKVFGIFVRTALQDDKAAIDYKTLYSGGLNILGSPWGRADDNIGLGYAHLDGGNGDIKKSQVAEGYYRFVVNDILSVAGDVQYLKDDYKDRAERSSPKGWVLSLRATAEF